MSYTPQPAQPMSAREERNWSVLTHVIAGGVHVVTADWAGFDAALVLYFVFKDRGPFIRAHTVSALNFQLTMLIAVIIGWILSATVILAIIGVPLLIAVAVVNIIFSILAALAASRGEYYRYPMSIEFVKA